MNLLLKNGLIYDGTTDKPKISDVYLEGGIIKQIGVNLSFEGVKEIDCTNQIVCPGFIDAHSHNDFFLTGEKTEDYILPKARYNHSNCR